MAIIEKGCWDETFSLEGGGHAHMKLQFVLNEEERSRIRLMRESAMKKKHDMDTSINLRHRGNLASPSDPVGISLPNEPEVSDFRASFVKTEVISHKVVDPQAGSLAKLAISSIHPKSDYPERERRTLESAIPNAMDRSEGASSSPVESQLPQLHEKKPVKKLETHMPFPMVGATPVSKEDVSSKSEGAIEKPEKSTLAISSVHDDHVHETENQGPLEKTPSNVRKMISAFESNLVQDIGPPKRVPSVQSQLNKAGRTHPLQDQESNIGTAEKSSLKELEDHFITPISYQTAASIGKRTDNATGDITSRAVQKLESDATPISSKGKFSKTEDVSRETQGVLNVKEKKKELVDLKRPSTLGTATSSGKMHENQSSFSRAYNLSSEPLGKSYSSSVERGDRRNLSNQVSSNQKPNSIAYYQEEYNSFECSGMWIFPDNARRLCITTAGKKVKKVLERHFIEATTLQERDSSESQMTKKNNFPLRTEQEIRKGQKVLSKQQGSRSGSSPDDASGRLIGQVMKIVVILGFGALVFLTRQKEPRKSKKEENISFSIPEYIEDRTFPE